jgi:hypothetical protein
MIRRMGDAVAAAGYHRIGTIGGAAIDEQRTRCRLQRTFPPAPASM